MRHVFYLNGTRKVYDGAFPCRFVVIGQRNEEAARPQHPGENATKEQITELRKLVARHQVAITNGAFAMTTIEWCETREEAAGIVAKFGAPDWLNVRVEPLIDPPIQ